MKTKVGFRPIVLTGVISLLASLAAAQTIDAHVCGLLLDVGNAIGSAATTLVVLMFTYGGVRYVANADNAGGRKAGLKICQHSLIAGMILSLGPAIFASFGMTGAVWFCT
ncbi:hypothetical protein ACFLRF_00185 [Candidatus Altiarchaeota archaeon]